MGTAAVTEVNPYERGLKFAKLFPGDTSLRANRLLAGLQLEQHRRQVEEGAATFWTSPLVPAEILNAFGIQAVTPETQAAVLASAGMGKEFLDVAEGLLGAGGACTFQRCALGALEAGVLPAPDGCVTCSTLCDDAPLMCDFVSQRHGKEHFLIDVPQECGDEAEDYVAGQLVELTEFCGDHARRRLEAGALGAALAESNAARVALARANELRKDSPPPIYGVSALRMAGGMLLQKLGLPGGRLVAEEFEAELRELIAEGNGKHARHRLLWLHLFPLFDPGFLRYIERERGGVIVFEESSQVWWEPLDPALPYQGLARRILTNPFLGRADRRARGVLRLVEEYGADGVVNFSHLGCQTMTGGVQFVRDALREEDVPFLELNGDCNDNGNYAFEPLRTRIDAFFEMLA